MAASVRLVCASGCVSVGLEKEGRLNGCSRLYRFPERLWQADRRLTVARQLDGGC